MFGSVYSTPVTEVSTVQKEPMGSIRFERGKMYKYVKFRNITATVALVAGDPVAYENEDGYQNNHVVADLTDASNPPICAGYACAAVAGVLLTDYFGWIQIQGALTLGSEAIGGSEADGNLLFLTTTDKTTTLAVEADSAAAMRQIIGIIRDAATKTIIAQCPL